MCQAGRSGRSFPCPTPASISTTAPDTCTRYMLKLRNIVPSVPMSAATAAADLSTWASTLPNSAVRGHRVTISGRHVTCACSSINVSSSQAVGFE